MQIFIDNTTCVAYTNNYGGEKELDDIAREIWFWRKEKNTFVGSTYSREAEY